MKKRKFREIDLSLTVQYDSGAQRHLVRKVLLPQTVDTTFEAKSLLYKALRKAMHQADSEESARTKLENKNGNIQD